MNQPKNWREPTSTELNNQSYFILEQLKNITALRTITLSETPWNGGRKKNAKNMYQHANFLLKCESVLKIDRTSHFKKNIRMTVAEAIANVLTATT